jgi:hypothetical protein
MGTGLINLRHVHRAMIEPRTFYGLDGLDIALNRVVLEAQLRLVYLLHILSHLLLGSLDTEPPTTITSAVLGWHRRTREGCEMRTRAYLTPVW